MWKTIFKTLDKRHYAKDEDIEKISPYMFLRWLGNHPTTIAAAGQLNLYPNIPMIHQYKMAKTAFGGKNIYIQMPVLKKETPAHVLNALAWHFKISAAVAPEYLKFMKQPEVDAVIEEYDEYMLYSSNGAQ